MPSGTLSLDNVAQAAHGTVRYPVPIYNAAKSHVCFCNVWKFFSTPRAAAATFGRSTVYENIGSAGDPRSNHASGSQFEGGTDGSEESRS